MAILTIEGTTAMHFASLITLSGIALSGVLMISVRTLVEASRRFSISDWSLSLSLADQAKLAQSIRLALSTKRHLGDAYLILLFISDLFCARSEQIFSILTELTLPFRYPFRHRVRTVK